MRALPALTIALATSSVSAAENPRWAPGEATTSTVRGEVQGPDDAVGDGVYDRFDGDLEIGLGLGAELDFGAERRPTARLSLHYFATAGIYASYGDALRSSNEPDRAQRKLGLGVDLRPTFIPRWSLGMQSGPSFVDLVIDSISLGMGAFWSEPGAADFGDELGFEGSLGLGLPVLLRASGPWLEARAGMRWADEAGREDSVLVLLSWHGFVLTPLARD